jgi:hypothetical protein
MDSKELLIGVLSKTLNIDETGVASLFNEDGSVKDEAEQTILNWDADRIKGLKSSSTKTAFDDGFKKAQSEVLSKFENDLKAKTGFKSDKKGIDLVLDYAASQKPADAVTEDVIKKHPLYLSTVENLTKQVEEAKTEGETKLNQFKSEINKKESFNVVKQKALEIFHALKPVLSADPIKAKKQEELLLDKFSSFEYEIQGDRIVVLKDGKVLENQQGHAIAFDKLVKDTANDYYDFHKVDNKTSPGHKNTAGDNKNAFTFEIPKTDEEYAKMVTDKSIPVEQRLEIDKAYTASKAGK